MTTATAAATPTQAGTSSKLRAGSLIMAIGGLGFFAYALLFFVRNFTSFFELGIGFNEVEVTRDQVRDSTPHFYHYVEHLQIALSAFIAATGLAVAALAWFGVRRGQMWAFVTAVVVPVFALAVALPDHYAHNFDTLGHLGLIYADTILFVVGVVLAYIGLREQHA